MLHWRTISYLLIPLPVLALVYGAFLPESPIWKKAHEARDPEDQPLMEGLVSEEKNTSWIRMLARRSVTDRCIPATILKS